MSKEKAKGNLPYDKWLETLDEKEKAAAIKRLITNRTKQGTKKGTTKKKTGRRNTYTRRNGTGRYVSNGGRAIVYPNIVGYGPYHLSGDVSWGQPDSYFRGNLKGGLSDTVSGLGEYVVRRNSLMSAIDMGQSPPRVMNTNRGEATILNHREYITDITSGPGTPSLFNLAEYALNPGNDQLFPFLGKIAQRFQEYEIRGMLVELKSLSSDYAAALSLGSIFMAADYNVLGPAPPNKQALENMEYASSCKPSRSLIMPIECDPRNAVDTHLYVAINSDYQGGDKRLFDLAKIYIGSQGIPTANTPIAEMWVTYEIALFKPIISADTIASYDYGIHARCTGITADYPLGDNQSRIPGSSPAIITTETDIIFPEGIVDKYLISLLWNGGSTGATAGAFPTVMYVSNTKPLAVFNDGSAFQQSNVSASGDGTNCTRLVLTFIIQTTLDTQPFVPSIRFLNNGNFPDNSLLDIIVTAYNNNIAEDIG